MKIKSLVNTTGILGCAAFLLSAPAAKAGEMIIPEPIPIAPMTSLLDPIETTLSGGFDTVYMFRGFDLGQEAPWVGLDFALPLGTDMWLFRDLSLNAGLWYVNPTEGPANSAQFTQTPFAGTPSGYNLNPKRGIPDDELDAYIGIGSTVGPVDVAIGYVHYFLGPEQSLGAIPTTGVNDQNELGINLGTSLGPIDFGFGYAYNFDAGDSDVIAPLPSAGPGVTVTGKTWQLTHYWEPTIGTGFDLTDRIAADFTAAFGFYGDKFSHYQLSLSFPIIMAESVVLEPYVAYMDNKKGGIPTTDDTFFGGISLSVSF